MAELCNQFLRLWRDDRHAKWALIIMPYITFFSLVDLCKFILNIKAREREEEEEEEENEFRTRA